MHLNEHNQHKWDAHTTTPPSSRGVFISIRLHAVRLEAQGAINSCLATLFHAVATNKMKPNRTHQSVVHDLPITMLKDIDHHYRIRHSSHDRRAIRNITVKNAA